ncbi:MAG: hypothetical protein J7539_05170 [Niabella sp.]|nr:hypothetical protein [Niabella sp.]
MPKLTLLLCLMIAGGISSAQEQLLFDQRLTKETIKLIGMYPQYDENRTYEKYNFFITDKKVIDSLIKTVKYGARTEKILEQNDFSIIVTKNNKVIDRWSISPRFSNINTDGSPNVFDISILEKLARRFPMRYNYYRKIFSSPEQYKRFEDSMLLRDNILFIYEPDFKYEGSFEVEFPKNAEFPNAGPAIEYINKKLGKQIDKSKFSAAFPLTEYNLRNQNQITLIVNAPEWVFKGFKDDKVLKKTWTPAKFDAMIFEKL